MRRSLLNGRTLPKAMRQALVFLTLLLLPKGAMADNYPFSINGNDITSENIGSISGVSYDADTYTITLSGATISGPIEWDESNDLTIVLNGTNSVINKDANCAINTNGCNLIFLKAEGAAKAELTATCSSSQTPLDYNNITLGEGLYWKPVASNSTVITDDPEFIIINGTVMTDDTPIGESGDQCIKYNSKDKILTFKNFTYPITSPIITGVTGLTIKLEGLSIVEATSLDYPFKAMTNTATILIDGSDGGVLNIKTNKTDGLFEGFADGAITYNKVVHWYDSSESNQVHRIEAPTAPDMGLDVNKKVELTKPYADGDIYYTIVYADGKTPSVEKTKYTAAFALEAPGTVEAWAEANGATTDKTKGKLFGYQDAPYTIAVGDTKAITAIIPAIEEEEGCKVGETSIQDNAIATFSEGVITAVRIGNTTLSSLISDDEPAQTPIVVLNPELKMTADIIVGEPLSNYFEGSNEFCTFYNEVDKPYAVPQGMKAYVVTGASGSGLVIEETTVLPPNTVVLLEKAEGIALTKVLAEGAAPAGNLLKRATSEVAVTTESQLYVLYNDTFVKASVGSIPAGKNYLDLSTSAGARGSYNLPGASASKYMVNYQLDGGKKAVEVIGNVVCTFNGTTATIVCSPKAGNYINAEDIIVYKTVSGSSAQARGPGIDNSPLAITAASTNTTPREESSYTFTAEEDPNLTYEITANFHQLKDLDVHAQIELPEDAVYTYTGQAIEPEFKVTATDVELKKDEDYTVKYKDNVNAGQGSITITATTKTIYTGSKTVNFDINQADVSFWFENADGSKPKEDQSITFGETFTEPTLKMSKEEAAEVIQVKYSVDDKSVATIDASTGKLTILKSGTVEVTAAAAKDYTKEEGSNYKADPEKTKTSYKLTIKPAAKTTPTLKFSTTTATATMGEEFEVPTLTVTPEGLEGITYTSSNTDAATINAEGKVTLVGEGETKITAAFAGNENYEAAEASYTLTVERGVGSGYPLWVGDIQVTGDNEEHILGEGNLTFIYNDETKTLLITNNEDASIVIESRMPLLSVYLNGDNENKLKAIYYNNLGDPNNKGSLYITCYDNTRLPSNVTIKNDAGKSVIYGFDKVEYNTDAKLSIYKPEKTKYSYTGGQMMKTVTNDDGMRTTSVADEITITQLLTPIDKTVSFDVRNMQVMDKDGNPLYNEDRSPTIVNTDNAIVSDVLITLSNNNGTTFNGFSDATEDGDNRSGLVIETEDMTDAFVLNVAANVLNDVYMPGDNDFANSGYIGLTILLPAGYGNIQTNLNADPDYDFHILIAETTASRPNILGKGKVLTPFRVTKTTYCYIYLVKNKYAARTRMGKREKVHGKVYSVGVYVTEATSVNPPSEASGGVLPASEDPQINEETPPTITPEQTYKVIVAKTTGGEVVTSKVDDVKADEQVNMIINPAEGYHLESLVVTTDQGASVTVRDTEDGKGNEYKAFNMPAANAFITAIFAKDAEEAEEESKDEQNIFIFKAEYGEVISNMLHADEGQQVNLKAIPVKGFEDCALDELFVINDKDERLDIKTVETKEEGLVYYFIMKGEKVFIYNTFKAPGEEVPPEEEEPTAVNGFQTGDKAADIYDLRGRKVDPSHLRPGIYIKNGKLIVIK